MIPPTVEYLPLEGIIALAWTLTGISVLLTLGRFILAWKLRRAVSACDTLNGLAAIAMVAFVISWQVCVPQEYQRAVALLDGVFIEYPPNYTVKFGMNFNIATSLFFWTAIYFVKGSFLALYWKIFTIDTKFKPWWKLAAVYIIAAYLVTFMLRFILCGSPDHVTDFTKECQENKAVRNMHVSAAWCILDGTGDIMLMILPLMMLKHLFLCCCQKIQLIFLFSLVGFNLVTNILRTYFTIGSNFQDYPHLNAPWIILQITLSVGICALPVYGSQLTRKKRRQCDGMRFVNLKTGTSEMVADDGIALSSLESFGANREITREIDSIVTRPCSIQVSDVVSQRSCSEFRTDGDQRVRHTVSIWH